MQNLICVQIMQPKAHFDKELPYLCLVESSTHLSFEIFAKITVFTVFHDDVDGIIMHVRVIVLANILTIYLGQDGCFKCCLTLLSSGHVAGVDLLKDVQFAVVFASDGVDYAKRAGSELLKSLEVLLLGARCCFPLFWRRPATSIS